jgi:ubiquinol-cytochrome c reductase iron-sulfur subunit
MTQSEAAGEPTRRDFLYIATGMAGVVGAAVSPGRLSIR